MKWIAALLLCGVFFRHGADRWLAEGSRIPRAGWFYILGGLWEIILAAVLLAIFAAMHRTAWVRFAMAAMVIAISEGFQTAACRLAIKDMSALRGASLCEHVSGMPIGAVSFSIYLICICWYVTRTEKK